jgi:hypothetical protein
MLPSAQGEAAGGVVATGSTVISGRGDIRDGQGWDRPFFLRQCMERCGGHQQER